MNICDGEVVENLIEDSECENLADLEPFPGLESIYLTGEQLHIVNDSSFKNVLIVDDDEFVAKDYGYMLSAHGFFVSYAYDTDQAIKIIYLFGKSFDFIILDIRMYYGRFLTAYDTAEGRRTGTLLSREMQEYAPSAFIIGLTNSTDSFDKAWFEANDRQVYCNKNEYTPILFAKYLQTIYVEEHATTKMDKESETIDNWTRQLTGAINQSKIQNINIHITEEITMGDKYQAAQVGAQGKYAHAHDMVFTQIWDKSKDTLDLNKLSIQLSELREVMAKEASSQKDYIEIGNVASAELEITNGNGPKALEYLRQTGEWTLRVAEKIGVGVAIEAIKASLDL